MGLPAAIAFYTALGMITATILRATGTRKRQREFPAFAFACILAAGLHALLDFTLQMPATAALLAAIMGIGWAQSFSVQQSPRHRVRG